MTDYTSTFTESTGDTIDTTDFSTEFNAIATASATKLDATASADRADAVVETGASTIMNMIVIDIGDWDMDATATITVNHGLTVGKIRSFQVTIRQDNATDMYPIHGHQATPEGYVRINTSQFVLTRVAGGIFDDTVFNATSYNRGWITVWYTD